MPIILKSGGNPDFDMKLPNPSALVAPEVGGNSPSITPAIPEHEEDELTKEIRVTLETTARRRAGFEPEETPAADMLVQTAVPSPLRDFSLLGMADELEAQAADTRPLFGNFMMQGQATMLYAEPNSGKTLLMMKLLLNAVEASRILPSNVFYINADDSSEGLAVKGRHLQDIGVHMLAPGRKGFRTDDLVGLMAKAVESGTARGTCIILDTAKKFTDLMDKKRTSAFADDCRRFVMAGGTIVALGHTTKNPNADGTPRYQGATDFVEDFDAVYVGQPLAPKAEGDTRKVVKFTRLKCRANSPATLFYGYDCGPSDTYGMMLASVQSIHPDDLDGFVLENEDVCDPVVMNAVCELIEAGNVNGKMALAKAAARASGVSHRRAVEVVEKYTGTTPREHLWTFERGARGVQTYRLIEQPKGGG